ALVIVEVRKVSKFTTKNRKTIVNVQVGDDSGRLKAVFFNQPWRERQLKVGMQLAMFGKPDSYRGVLQMSNPLVDLIGDRTGRIVPIYPQSEKCRFRLGSLQLGLKMRSSVVGNAAFLTRCPVTCANV
ncbi:MAG: hypothetical protein EBU22_07235, partial [Actinobacteria bacterium]|nr:hypothetical protein [Actinomycetota bacterium]